MTTETLKQNLSQTALENVLDRIKKMQQQNSSDSPPLNKTEAKTTTKKRTRKKTRKVYGDPNNYSVKTRKQAKEDKEKYVAQDGDYIPVEIWYFFKWKCPSCRKANVQEFANIHDVYGPAWTAIGVTCDKCKKHFEIAYDDATFED